MLLNYLKTKDVTVNQAAKTLGISIEHFCRLLTDSVSPSPALKNKIDRVLAGENLRQLAVEKYGSQRACAKVLNISEGYFSQIIEGTRNPKVDLAIRIEDMFGGRIKAHELLLLKKF
jgi:plasmid maintenance system antidote protein VapI